MGRPRFLCFFVFICVRCLSLSYGLSCLSFSRSCCWYRLSDCCCWSCWCGLKSLSRYRLSGCCCWSCCSCHCWGDLCCRCSLGCLRSLWGGCSYRCWLPGGCWSGCRCDHLSRSHDRLSCCSTFCRCLSHRCWAWVQECCCHRCCCCPSSYCLRWP